MKGGRSSLTEPIFDNIDHLILYFRPAIGVVRVMERLKDLVNGQRDNTKSEEMPITLLMASSGFESFDQALIRTRIQDSGGNKR